MRNYKFRLYPNKVVEAELDRDYNPSRNILIKALSGREPASMLAELRPLQRRNPSQAGVLKREAPYRSLG
ncbi:MAG: hypothetical protein ACP5RE_00285 [Candidatus Acidifodinimicrobium sp.]